MKYGVWIYSEVKWITDGFNHFGKEPTKIFTTNNINEAYAYRNKALQSFPLLPYEVREYNNE